jgi:large subunit ribosomal protein L37Ae
MVKDKSLKSGNRFGARYGRRNRDLVAKIETEQRKAHKCPYCNMPKVERKAAGIWCCKKCGKVFASKAYTVGKVTIQEAVQESEVASTQEKEMVQNGTV